MDEIRKDVGSILQELEGRLVTEQNIKYLIHAKKSEANLTELLKYGLAYEAVQIKDQLPYCVRCNNHQFERFALLPAYQAIPSKYYCLECIQMGRMTQGMWLYHFPSNARERVASNQAYLSWPGTLSKEQARAAQALIDSLNNKSKPILVHAVTGAGKTEMIFPVINEVLMQGGRVGVASPRIDVCIELYPRFQEAFQTIDVVVLYGGMEEGYRYTPLVIATTHQLLRFKEAFDLLIVDEVDAYPYAGSDMLHYAVEQAVKKEGKRIYLTATPDEALEILIEDAALEVTTLPARYHGYPLPEPIFKWIGHWKQTIENQNKYSYLWRLLTSFLIIDGIKLVFMPNIKLAERLYAWLTNDFSTIRLACVHALDPQRKEKIAALRSGEYEGLIVTTILERGVTFSNCHVCIIGSESPMYSRAALVQMSGRVGRRADYPTGQLIFGHFGINQKMLQARQQIRQMNQLANEQGLITYE
ncbi:DEAD/DEAH box helicase [Fundicoccus culcitae]|uniref:Helicase-related protein n=1 Tax=Fundicoccus culcitae TaxID=2969821 RepID=A0ABY5P3E8_9LACT|nr:DEAD/DEAH box helicase [Fundicoccus culcitae]UUX32940.1 helicase-related protein [Fundicoccus culcitae]